MVVSDFKEKHGVGFVHWKLSSFVYLTGYARIILVFVSFYFMAYDPVMFMACYVVSGLLDAFDGHAARALNQSKCHK